MLLVGKDREGGIDRKAPLPSVSELLPLLPHWHLGAAGHPFFFLEALSYLVNKECFLLIFLLLWLGHPSHLSLHHRVESLVA